MKSINNSLIRFIVLLPLLTLFGGCGGGGSSAAPSSHNGGSSVAAATLDLITVTPANPSIAPGASQQFTATGTFSNGTTQDLTSLVTWTSSGVVQISNTGLVTAPGSGATGTATITATSGSGTISGFTSLSVTGSTVNTTPVSITVTPANPSIAPGASQQFTATGTFSNGTTQDLTSQVTWSSSGVVQISNTGLATSPSSGSTGTATITATSGTVSGATKLTVTSVSTAAANVMAISVNGSLCSSATSAGYFNKPCVSVTVCIPGTSTCQTLNDILLDTGSYGLRIFKQKPGMPGLSLALPQVPSGSGSLTECTDFADGSSIWGPVQLASIQLGGEPPVQVPIQVIDASFGKSSLCPSLCADDTQHCPPDPDPVTAGYTGILGVGSSVYDCGSQCANAAGNGNYFSCVGSSCVGTKVASVNQVQNPVASLPQDYNGLVVQLPGVQLGGISSQNGFLILGINTQTNNIPASQTVISTDQYGEFTTTFNGDHSTSFLDTGSNALYFASALPPCSNVSPLSDWYCPSVTTPLSATTGATANSQPETVNFYIGNFSSLTSANNQVFSEIGGTDMGGSYFDWGLPFFMGRSVFVGIGGKTSSLGAGPYVAY